MVVWCGCGWVYFEILVSEGGGWHFAKDFLTKAISTGRSGARVCSGAVKALEISMRNFATKSNKLGHQNSSANGMLEVCGWSTDTEFRKLGRHSKLQIRRRRKKPSHVILA